MNWNNNDPAPVSSPLTEDDRAARHVADAVIIAGLLLAALCVLACGVLTGVIR